MLNKKRAPRVKTGIKNLDSLTNGGFYPNSTNLVIGNAGVGKSTLATQFLIEGIKNKEKGLYISFEEKKSEFFENMSKLSLNLEKLEKNGDFFYLEYTPMKVKDMLDEGGGAIESLILKNKIKRVVIDTLSSFTLMYSKNLSERRQAVVSLFGILKNWGCTSVLIYEGNPESDINEENPIVEPESDSIILIHDLLNKKGRKRLLEIYKMRGANHSNKAYEIKIGKKGIELSKNPSSIKLKEN